MLQEQREQERLTLNLQARITYRHTEDTSPIIETVAANIAPGGAFLKTVHPFPMAAQVRVEFFLSVDDLKKLRFILSVESLKQLTGRNIWVRASGIVIRHEADGIGIMFDTDYQLTPIHPSQIVKS
jgi:hypothetical protein